jgi:hypothetical protein
LRSEIQFHRVSYEGKGGYVILHFTFQDLDILLQKVAVTVNVKKCPTIFYSMYPRTLLHLISSRRVHANFPHKKRKVEIRHICLLPVARKVRIAKEFLIDMEVVSSPTRTLCDSPTSIT